MKFGYKRLFAALTAAAIAVSTCGCMDNGKIMTVDGMEINNGIYLYYQQAAYSEAQNKIDSARQEKLDNMVDEIINDTSSESAESTSSSSSSSGSSEKLSYFAESIDGKSTAQWVNDETMRLVKQYVAVQRLCEQKGIALDEIEKSEINTQAKSVWEDVDNYFLYFYGYDTLGKYYESMGISRDSYKLINTESKLKDKLFSAYYDKDGEKSVSDEEINSFAKDNYAAAVMIELEYKDADGEVLTSDSDKKAIDEKAEEYAKRISNGESIVDVQYDIDLQAEKDSALPQIESYYDKNPVEGKTKEEYVAEELAKLTVEKKEENDLIKYYQKEKNDLDEKVSEFIFNAKDDGKAATLKTDDCVYVITRLDILAQADWLEDSRQSILINIKGEKYENMLDDSAKDYAVEANSYLVDTKYKPERLEVSSSSSN